MKNRRHRTIRNFFFLFILLVTLSFLSSFYLFKKWSFYYILAYYFFSINLSTFLFYGLDKLSARLDRGRIPEFVLISIIFPGGTMGAYLGRKLFRHKTQKRSFIKKFWITVLIQIILVLAVYFLINKFQINI